MKEENNLFDKCGFTFLSIFTKQEKTAFYSSVFAGLLAHGYMFVNKMVNHDDMHYAFDVGKGKPSVYNSLRWALPAVSNLSGHWNTPWLISIISLVLLGLASIIVIRITEVESKTISMFVGVLLAVFPSVTGMYTYMFSLDGYLWSVVFALLAALFVIREKIWLAGVAFVLLIVSLAIYQAFIPFFFGVICIYVLRNGLRDKINLGLTIKLFVKVFAVSIFAIVSYLLLSKLFLVDVARRDRVGVVSPKAMINAIKDSGIDLVNFFWGNDYGVSALYVAIATAFLFIASIIMLIWLQKRRTANGNNIVIVLALFGVIVSSIMIYVINPGGYIHIIMKYPFVTILITVLIILDSFLERFESNTSKKGYLFLCAMLISIFLLSWNYIIVANKTYYKMQIADNWVYGYSVRLIERAEQCDGFTASIPVCFIGAPSIEENNQEICNVLWGENRAITGALSPDLILGEAATPYNCYEDYLQEHLGWSHKIYREYDRFAGIIPEASVVRKELSVYPSTNSMTVRDGILFVRFE